MKYSKYENAFISVFTIAVTAVLIQRLAISLGAGVGIVLTITILQMIITILRFSYYWPNKNRNRFIVGLFWPFQFGYEKVPVLNQPWLIYGVAGALLLPYNLLLLNDLNFISIDTALSSIAIFGVIGAVSFVIIYGIFLYYVGYFFKSIKE
jgi:hypothetical protein